MKQKNLILMVVAVGCGLGAAFLTSRMNAGPKQEAIPQKEVLIAIKDLNPPTKFTKEALKDLVKWKRMNAADVPDNAIETEEELLDYSLTRPVAANVFLQKTDVSKHDQLLPPTGKAGLMSVKLPLAQVTPFVKPTSRVNLIGTVQNRNTQQVKGRVLIPNMHVMAVDSEYIPTPGAPAGRTQVQNVTLAVNNDETTLIRMCETAGVTLSFVVIGKPEQDANKMEDWDVNEVIAWINEAVNGTAEDPNKQQPQGTTPMVTYVKVPVAVVDLPAGTELTDEVINTKFRMKDEVVAPDNAVLELKAHIGHYLKKEVGANQFVSRANVTNKAPDTPKGKPTDDAATAKETPTTPDPVKPEVKPEPKAAKAKAVTVDKTITGPSGTKTFRYEQQADKTWKLTGEVQPDGSVTPTNGGVAPTAPEEDKKDEAPAPAPGGKRVS